MATAGVIRPMTLAPAAIPAAEEGTAPDGVSTMDYPYPPSGGGGTGGGGPPDQTDWKVFISGGTTATWADGGGVYNGHHPGGSNPIPNVIQGSRWFGFLRLQASNVNTFDYQVLNATWTFPTGAVKGYGIGRQGQEPGGPPLGGAAFNFFDSGPTLEGAEDPEDVKFAFTEDDLNFTYSSPDIDHVTKSFYWGPKSVGPLSVHVEATFAKIVDGAVVDTFYGSDTTTFILHAARI